MSDIQKYCIGILGLALLTGTLCGNDFTKPHAQQMQEFGGQEVNQEIARDLSPLPLEKSNDLREPSHVVFGYHPYWNGTSWQNYEYSQLSHLAWFGLGMNSQGSITAYHGWPVTSLVEHAHNQGVKVIVTVTLFESEDIGTLLGNATYRLNAINHLVDQVSTANADGVNIDFEFVPSYAREDFNTFISDLQTAFHDQIPNSEVSIAMPAVDWWGSYDYDFLSDHSDGLMIMAYGYSWSGSSFAGPNSPLNQGFTSWYIRRTIEDYLSKTGGDGSQLILGLPWYGHDWPVINGSMGAETTGSASSITYSAAEPAAQSYGKNYNATAPAAWYNYNSGGPRQVWYDDSTSLAAKYQYAIDMDIKGVGIWALGYDGGRSEIWGGLSDAFGATAAPLVSSYFSVKNLGGGSIQVSCAASQFAEWYDAYVSLDGQSFTLADSSLNPVFTLHGFESEDQVFVKIRTRNEFGNSSFSELLGTSISNANSSVLVVQGFERTAGTSNNFDYIIEHGSAILGSNRHYDGASNEAVIHGAIDLSDYDVVDWISGEEGTANSSFLPSEQAMIRDYLEQGGRIFVSGSEIGYDLIGNGSGADQSFYRNYLKANYVVDDAGSYSLFGPGNGIFAGMSGIPFDNGSHHSYNVDYPDGIQPYGGSVNNLRYENADYTSVGGAGIQYLGTFGTSSIPGGVVYLGVGFEAIYPEDNRISIMTAVLDYLESTLDYDPPHQSPDDFSLLSVYPNPFNGAFSFVVEGQTAGTLSWEMFNVRGQLVVSGEESIDPGKQEIRISAENLRELSSGTYLLSVMVEGKRKSRPISMIK